MLYECAAGRETAAHAILLCKMFVNEREVLRKRLAPIALETRGDLSAASNNPESLREIARWLFRTTILAMYDLAEAIGDAVLRGKKKEIIIINLYI